MNALDTLMVMTSVPNKDVAIGVARELVEMGLAACVNVLSPCVSVYRWEGRTEEAEEVPLIIKCHQSRYAALEAKIIEIHPYDVPEIIALPLAAGSAAYLAWVRESATASAQS